MSRPPRSSASFARNTGGRASSAISPLTTASAEDLIVLKAFADRDRDWADIAGIVARQPRLDRNVILERLTPLAQLKEAPGMLDRVKRFRAGA